MAQTVGLVNATLIVATVAGAQITHLTGVSLNLSHSPRDASSKDSLGDEEILEGQRSGEMTADYWDADDAAEGFIALHTVYANRSTVSIVFGTGVVGDSDYTGNYMLTSLTRGGGVEETATGSVSFKRTGLGTLAINT